MEARNGQVPSLRVGKIPRRGRRAKAEEARVEARPKRRVTRKAKSIDVDELVDKYGRDVLERLGVDQLGLGEGLLLNLARDVIEALTAGTTSKPDLETLLRRLERNKQALMELVSYKLAASLDSLSEQQLEFVVNNGGRSIVGEVPRLYKSAKSHGREDLIDTLRALWNKYGKRSPVTCPKCGFDSIMPDHGCFVCGHVVSERYIRERTSFDSMFKEFVKVADTAALSDLANIGYILISSRGLVHPRSREAQRGEVLIPVTLNSKDLSLIFEEISEREGRKANREV
ncbi:MAG: hypothetical protein ABWK00_04925 [Desulfurococcaceae archaeon]